MYLELTFLSNVPGCGNINLCTDETVAANITTSRYTLLSYTVILLRGGVPGATLHLKLDDNRFISKDASDSSIASDVVCLQTKHYLQKA